ncbi:hypothetical protein EDD86DRAFT_185675, partial [Gorgonomyces haynaldii]
KMIVAAFASLVSAQAVSCNQNNPTFQQCVSLQLTTPTGQTGPSDPSAACSSLSANQASYYKCLCEKWTAVIYCYTSYCAGDPALNGATQYQTQFCAASANNPTTSTSLILPVASSTAQPSATATVKSNDAASVAHALGFAALLLA